MYGLMAIDPLRNLFDSMPDDELTTHLIAGITKREVLERIEAPRSIWFHALDIDALVLPPLPNTIFTRDTSCWIYGGVAINSMRKRSEEHTSALQSLMRISYADFCLKKKKNKT